MTDFVTIPQAEAVSLAAQDNRFFCSTYFPKTYRQAYPHFFDDMWNLLEDSQHENVAAKMFRGSSKTTLLRTFAAKRMAYGISRTILFVSASQANALKSTLWMRRQIEVNHQFSETFGLVPGSKWTDEWFEVYHRTLDIYINVVALGITGGTRGLNIDDYRPDLIVVDDPLDEENTATEEQRKKVNARFFGALQKSLAPRTESPNSKMVLLQTPFVDNDLVDLCSRHPSWAVREYSCFDDEGQSRWPERFPTETLKKDKQAHVANNNLSLWMREMEVTIVSEETSMFLPSWVKFWSTVAAEARFPTFIGIDPVPPAKQGEDVGSIKPSRDFEAHVCVGVQHGKIFVLDSKSSRGHQPDWTISTFFTMCSLWRPVKIRAEGIAYQRTLKWILDKECRERRAPWLVESYEDKRKKRVRISQALVGLASRGLLYFHPSQIKLLEQFLHYPSVPHDDELDALSMAVIAAMEWIEPGDVDWYGDEGESFSGQFESAQEGWLAAP